MTPRVANVIIAPNNDKTRVRIQNYSELNPVALRRILTDPNLSSNAALNQTYVTSLLSFDPETLKFNPGYNLVNPPKVSNEPGKSRIWNDFTFQEIGKGDDFINMESIIEKDPANPQAMASGIAPPHPFLSAEKVTRVNQWVVERAEMESDEPEPEPDLNFALQLDQLEAPRETPASVSGVKKTPGIRTRKAAGVAKPPTAPISEPTLEMVKPSSTNPEKKTSTPRKRWKMQYEPTEDFHVSSPEKAIQPSGDLLLDKTPESSRGSSTTARAESPESKLPMPTFDPTKYGLQRPPQHSAKNSWGSSTSPKSSPANVDNLVMTPKKKPGKHSELIDVLTPITPGKPGSQPMLSFDQPALVPQNASTGDKAEAEDMQVMDTNKDSAPQDLLDLDCESETTVLGPSNATTSLLSPVESSCDDLTWEEKRLRDLRKSLRKKKGASTFDDTALTVSSLSRPPTDRREISMLLARQKLAELEKSVETMKDTKDETSTREFHRTMNHKAAKPSGKAKSKAEAKAKRQATLEDAWGIPKPVKKAQSQFFEKPDDFKVNTKAVSSEAKKQNLQRLQQQQEEAEAHQKTTKSVFEGLRPALEAAEYFSGPLTLEVQLGLVLIPLLPKTYDQGTITVGEWTRIFQPRNGLAAPTTKFIDRLTTAGSDVDHIVDLKTSKAEGKRHLFEQDYTEYNVSYEFHCRTTANQPFIIAIDEQGKHSIRKPTKTLGAVNLHFPAQTWDASVVLSGVIEHVAGSDPELEEAVRYLVDNLWVQPDKSLIRIFSRLPKGNKFVIEKVLMKRWTRHRHIRNGDAAAATATATDTTNATDTDNATSPTAESQVSIIHENENDIFLQVTEVQDLLIGSSTSDSQALRARCAPHPEMIKKDRLWYEVSLVSPAIEAILKTNTDVEIGERTEDWRSTDLLGKDATLFLYDDYGISNLNLSSSPSSSSPSPPPGTFLSPVASAIGTAGLGDLLRLTKTVVGKIDGIGYWNYGPGVEAVRLAATTAAAVAAPGATGAGTVIGTTAGFGAGPLSLPGVPVPHNKPPMTGTSSALVPVAAQQGRFMGLDDLDSIKEVESLVPSLVPTKSNAAALPPGMERSSSTSSARVNGVHELDYW